MSLENRTEVFECDCHAHGLGLIKWYERYDPHVHTGVDVNTETFGAEDSDSYVSIDLDFWYRGSGKGYYDLLWQRIRAAWRLLRGRRATFDNFHFTPGQIHELAAHLHNEYQRMSEHYNDDGVSYKLIKRVDEKMEYKVNKPKGGGAPLM